MYMDIIRILPYLDGSFRLKKHIKVWFTNMIKNKFNSDRECTWVTHLSNSPQYRQ